MTLPSEIALVEPNLSHTQWGEDPSAPIAGPNSRLRRYSLRQQKALFQADFSFLNNLAAIVAPAVGDDSAGGYAVGSLWVDVVADKSYRCTDASVGAAVWLDTSNEGIGSGATPPAGSPEDVSFNVFGKTNNGADATSVFGSVPIAGTLVSVHFVPPGTTSSSAGTPDNKWEYMPRNRTNGSTDLLAAPYDTLASGDFVTGVEKDLGPIHATPANLVLNVGDVIELFQDETGTGSSFFNNYASLRFTVTPS